MIKAIGTHIKVNNFEKSLKFYTLLGFTKVFEYGPDKSVKEDYNGIVFEHGGGKIEIADGHRAVKPEIFKQTVPSSKISLMIETDDIEDIISRCSVNGIELAVGPRHYYWGKLEVVVKDPDGTVLVFTMPYDKETSERLNADEKWSNPTTIPSLKAA